MRNIFWVKGSASYEKCVEGKLEAACHLIHILDKCPLCYV